MSECKSSYTASIPGNYTHGETAEDKRRKLIQLRRHLIGTLRSVERQLGIEQSIPERQR